MATLIGDSATAAGSGSFLNGGFYNNMAAPLPRPQTMCGGPSSSTARKYALMSATQSSPRMVSFSSTSMTNFGSSSDHSRKRPAATPYDSLKAMVRNKNNTNKRPAQDNLFGRFTMPKSYSTNAFLESSKSSPLLSRASTIGNLRDSSQHYHHQVDAHNKRPKIHQESSSVTSSAPLVVLDGESALHRACVQGDMQDISTLVSQDRVQAARAVRITSTKQMYNMGTYQLEEKQVQENYAFALNLAICSKHVDASTLELLANAAPGVLSTADGNAQECSLAVLFKRRPQDLHTADQFLLKNPECARVADRKGNTPLHIACQAGAGLDTIRHLVILYPEALFMYNAHGENPLMVAQRAHHVCSEQVATYLWEKQAETL